MKHALLIIILTTAGCAAVHPIAPGERQQETSGSDFELESVEGRPQGLVLQVRGEVPATGGALSLYRVVGEAEPELLQTVPIDARLRDALSEGVQLVDQRIPVAPAIAYQAQVVDSQSAVVARTDVLEVAWERPPARPESVVASAPYPDVVELRWSAIDDTGAIVFRRDVLADDSKFERVAELSTGRGIWVDRDVKPAGVYSYRIALSRTGGDFIQYGPPCEEVYASTPEVSP